MRSIKLPLSFALVLTWTAAVSLADPPSSTSPPSTTFSIISATYGADSIQKDVTDSVKNKIKQGHLDISANSSDLGGDPILGKVKTLTIQYSYNGQTFTQSFRESDQVSLPNGASVSPDGSSQVEAVQETPNPAPSNAAPSNAAQSDPATPVSTDTSVGAQTPSPTPKVPTDITTTDRQHFTKAKLISAADDGITIGHNGGISFLPFKILPADIQKSFHSNAGKAQAAEDARKAQDLKDAQQYIADQNQAGEAQRQAIEAQKQGLDPDAPTDSSLTNKLNLDGFLDIPWGTTAEEATRGDRKSFKGRE